MAWMPGASLVKSSNDGGSLLGGERIVTWHTFETTFKKSAAAGAAYLRQSGNEVHFVFNPVTGDVVQMLPTTRAGRGLANKAGGAQTNRRGSLHIQIEVIAMAKSPWTSHLTAEGRAGLAKLMDFIRAQGVPDRWIGGVAPGAYPKGQKRRFVPSGESGHTGHSLWVENDHGDPGAIAAPWDIVGDTGHGAKLRAKDPLGDECWGPTTAAALWKALGLPEGRKPGNTAYWRGIGSALAGLGAVVVGEMNGTPNRALLRGLERWAGKVPVDGRMDLSGRPDADVARLQVVIKSVLAKPAGATTPLPKPAPAPVVNIPTPLLPVGAPGSALSEAVPPLLEWILTYSAAHDVPPELAAAVCKAESGLNPDIGYARGTEDRPEPDRAYGPMQIKQVVAEQVGITDRKNPELNVLGGVKYLAWLRSRFRTTPQVIAAYHDGPTVVARLGAAGSEAGRAYVAKVTADPGVAGLIAKELG